MKLTCAILTVLPIVCGCATQRSTLLVPPEPAIVWPKPPDAARLRYVGELRGSTDLRPDKSMGEVWNELLHGPPPPSPLVSPHAVAVHADGKRIAVADTNAACVHVFDLAAQRYRREEQSGTPIRRFESPVGVAWAGESLWIADSRLHAVAVLNGASQRWIGQDVLKRPSGIAYCAANDLCYVADAGAHAVFAFDQQGGLAFQFGSRGGEAGQFNCPAHPYLGGDGSLWVVDALNFRVQRFGLDGTFVAEFGQKGDAPGDFALPKGIAAGPDGNVWVVDAHFENVQGFTPDGQLLMTLGREGQAPGEFWLPAGVCIDGQRRMWVADTYNRRVQVFELLP